MSLAKNQIIALDIQSISNDGNGVGRVDDIPVFVPQVAVGDRIEAKIVKDCKKYAFGITEKILVPSADRISVDCPCFSQCGGCDFRHISYGAELTAKRQFVQDAFLRLGKLQLDIPDVLPSPQTDGYRNKAQFPLLQKDGKTIVTGFYANRSHRMIECTNCKLQSSEMNQITQKICRLFEKYQIPIYNEASDRGLVRHIYLRSAARTGQIMVCLVCTQAALPHDKEIVQELTAAFSNIATIVLNLNKQKTNVIIGTDNIVLFGSGTIQDILCGVPVQLGPLSFYQVNSAGAEQLYHVAAEYAAPKPNETLLDLYCGAGTIGLSMAKHCRSLIGVEIVSEAVESAKNNASAMGCTNARFLCADAGQAATQLAQQKLLPDIIVLDPPRKGCDEATLNAVLQMSPSRIVMVSCNPATAARDVRYLFDNGYIPKKVQPVDLFPRTKHVETVVLMSKATE